MLEIERQPIETIIVANNREYFSPIDCFVPPQEKDEFVESDYDEADMDIMWLGDNKLVLTARDLDADFVDDISSLLGYRNLRFVVPTERQEGLCHDLIGDKESFQTVLDEIGRSLDPQIVPWGHTTQFQNLLNSISESGVSFRTPETPRPEGLWIPDYVDTKVGSRKFLLDVKRKNPNLEIQVPDGVIVDALDDAIRSIDIFTSQGKGVVVKANLGGSGIGVHIFRYEELMDPEARGKIEDKLRGNRLFNTDKIVVEELIEADFSQHGVDPSVDGMVKEDGAVELQAVDAMVIHHEGQDVGFYGCVAGKDLFTDGQVRQLREFTAAVGKELSQMGYRGWYDTDYILTPDGNFYTAEVNLRRTSMSYVVELAKHLVGDDWEEKVAIRTNDKYIRKNLEGASYRDIKDLISDLAYPIDDEKRGIIITQSVRSKYGRGKFGYCIIGKSQDDTKRIEDEIDCRVANLGAGSIFDIEQAS